MPPTVGSSVVVPASSNFTCTLISATSEPQPNGAHPEVLSVPIASGVPNASGPRIENGTPCSAKNRASSDFFVPRLICAWASCLMVSIWRRNAAFRCWQLYCLSANQLTPKMATSTATMATPLRFTVFTLPAFLLIQRAEGRPFQGRNENTLLTPDKSRNRTMRSGPISLVR